MDTLIALSKVVSQQKVKKIDVLGPDQNSELLVNKLYEGLRKNEIKTESDAMNCLYGGIKVSKRNMLAVKKRLEDKLINTMFFIDSNRTSYSNYQTKQLKTHLSFGVVNMLKCQNQLHLSAKIAEKCIKKAISQDMIDLAFILCQDLHQYYSILNYDKQKSAYYDKLDDQLTEQFKIEKEARKCFIYYGSFINQNKSFNPQLESNSIQEKMDHLAIQANAVTNYDFNYHYRNALFFRAWLLRDFDKMELIADAAIEFFKNKKGFSPLGYFSFLQKLGFIYERRQKLEEAIALYNEALNLDLVNGGTSWYNIRSHLFDAHMMKKDYNLCLKYLNQAVENPSFKKLHKNYREPWVIKKAFMQLLINMDKVDVSLDKVPAFSLSKFRNNVQFFSKDKRGLNIAIIIVQALHHLVKDQRSKFEDKLDALSQYAFRYLKNDETLRSNAFIKIILKLPEVNYHPSRWKLHTEKYRVKLKNASEHYGLQSKEIEIIKYEDLIELIEEMLVTSSSKI